MSTTTNGSKAAARGITVLILLLSVVCAYATASAELTAHANHDHIQIDFLYHGSTVGVSGISDPSTDIVIKITSPEGHQALKKRGKVGGALWMNVGELNFEHVPNFYSLHSTKKPENILSASELEKHCIGYTALENHVELTPVADREEKHRWFSEFIKFKEHSNLYTESEGRISLTPKDGKQNYYILTQWPYQAPPGDYLVTVYAVKDGKVTETAQSAVKVEQAGIVKTLSGMAKNNAASYGLLSIIAALGAGFGVGLIFRKGGGAH